MIEAAAALVAGLRTQRVEEVKYLVEAKVAIYRPIVTFMHDRLEETETGWVWPSEVLDHIRSVHPDGAGYSEEECRRDLETLDGWGVLISEQDVGNATNLEEFLRAARRYQVSERARRIERMVRDLENEDSVQGSLDPGRLRRMWNALVGLDRLLEAADPAVLDRDALRSIEAEWNAVEDTRAQIEEQAMRYLNDLNRQRESDEDEGDLQLFFTYRKLLRTYIDDFLLDLKDFRVRCTGLFADWKAHGVDRRLVGVLVRNERERKGDTRDPADLARGVTAAVRKLMGFPGPDGTARILENKTTVRLMALIAQMERMVLDRARVVDRRRDLELLALSFRNAASDEETNRIAAYAFGWSSPQHMYRYVLSELEINAVESPWLQPPTEVELRAAVRGNREFQAITPVRDKRAERAALRLRRAQEKAEERRFWDKLFNSGELLLINLTLPNSTALNRVTRVMRDCLRDPERTTRLLDGTVVQLHLPEDREAVAEVRVPDGILYTRPYRLTRQGVV